MFFEKLVPEFDELVIDFGLGIWGEIHRILIILPIIGNIIINEYIIMDNVI